MESLFPATTSFEDLVITNQRLGEGGFGSVFICQLGKKKVAAKKLSKSEKEIDNLTREASKLKKLRYGKHITYTYGVALKEKKLYMVMEYSECGDLQNYLIKNKASITYEQKILFCRGILLGLLHCHSMKIFHGDIKCSNVLLGKNLEPKLTDFGLSMTVDNIAYYSNLCKGSLYWTAPELLSIKDENIYQEFIADPYPCDVYSLGATFCQVSYDGTTEFIDSDDDPAMDIMLGHVSPAPKEAFLKEIVDGCCQFERNERISLDGCLYMLDNIAKEQLLVPAIDGKWQAIIRDIKANSELELPHSFILHRPKENLVVGPSNLSLLEWLCINNHVDAVEYMTQLRQQDQNQIEWLCKISKLCKSPKVASFLQILMQNSKSTNLEPSYLASPLQSFAENSEFSNLKLFKLIDSNPQQFIVMLIKAGANSYDYDLLRRAIGRCHNTILQTVIDNVILQFTTVSVILQIENDNTTLQTIIKNTNNFKNQAIHYAVEFGNIEAVKIAVDAGADLEWKDNQTGNTPLITAIENGKIEAVKILLELGVNVHSKGNSTQSGVEAGIPHRPLYLAALKGNREIVKLLVNAGATIDITSSEWHSLSQSLEQQGNISMVYFISNRIGKKSNPVESNSLCAAIRNKQPDLVQTLINSGTDIDEVGLDGYAPLHWAVVVDDEEIIRILVRAGADLDFRTSKKAQNFQSTFTPGYFSEYTPLHIAISKGHWGIARLLIESGADFSAKNGLQQTIMGIAAEQDKKVLEEIIVECAPVNSTSIRRAMESISSESIKIMINKQVNAEILSEYLCIAINSYRNDLAEHLLKLKVNTNKKYQGWTPFQWALFGRNVHIMVALVHVGASIRAESECENTPLIKHIRESNTEMVQCLVNKGIDGNARSKDGNALIYFVRDKETAEILVTAGADINIKNNKGRTPLIQLVSKSNIEMVQYLVDKGVDINARDDDKSASIHFVRDKEIAEILINAGADINAKNRYGDTLLIECVKESNTEMVQYLVSKEMAINTEDSNIKAPIHFIKSKEIAEIFVSAGADINAKDKSGKKLFDILIEKQNKDSYYSRHEKKKFCELLEYLKDINKK